MIGLPWTETTKAWEAEAFTAKTRVIASMLSEYGNVILYAGEANEATVTEHVPVFTREWQALRFPGFRTSDVFTDYDVNKPHWIEANVHAADAIRKRAQPGDMLGMTMGSSQALCATLLADVGLWNVEIGIGYSGVWAPFRIFESWAWRNFLQGKLHDDDSVRNYDAVISRPYDIGDFPAGDGKGGYFLYLGRVVKRKGVMIAADVCRRIGAKLIVAGQMVTKAEPGRIESADGTVLEGDVEYVGVVGPEERAKLLGGAIATFVPTQYFEPFGGSHVESLLTGTPAITTDWGVFRENIVDGENGWRCHNMGEFVAAARNAHKLTRADIRFAAQRKFGTAAVAPQYDTYLTRLAGLRREGFYEFPLEKVA